MAEADRLIEKAKNGDVAAFEQLVEQHQKKIFNIAFRMCGNIDDASDMAQEALIKIYKYIGKFKGECQFSTWLYRVVTNTCIDVLKKQKKNNFESIDKSIETKDGELLLEIADNQPLPQEVAEENERMEALNKAIANLNERYRMVIILREMQGFSYEEIAGILKCSEGTVKSRLNRARSALKEILLKNKELFKGYIV